MEAFVEVCISDSGLGISKERLTDGLRTFTQPESAKAQVQPTSECVATGFGLPLTRALIDLHGGRIWVDGEPGEATTFTFVSPVNRLDTTKDQSPKRVTVDVAAKNQS